MTIDQALLARVLRVYGEPMDPDTYPGGWRWTSFPVSGEADAAEGFAEAIIDLYEQGLSDLEVVEHRAFAQWAADYVTTRRLLGREL